MSRFDFLKKDFPDLYDLCTIAEQTNDLDLAMLKCRQAIEKIVHLLGGQSRDLFQNLNELEKSGVLDNNIGRIFHTIRTLANQSIHSKKKGASPSKVKMCLDFLLEVTIWFGIKQGKNYELADFSHDGIPVARKYLLLKDKYILEEKYATNNEKTIDPLAVREILTSDSEDNPDVLQRDTFETKEEYEQRIASLPPVPIGTATLDMRHQDDYTKIVFLIHQIVYDKRFHIPSIDAFFVDVTHFSAKKIVSDGQLLAKLKVFQGQIWCDCSQIYLRKEDNFLPVQIIRWNKLSYETDSDYKKRIAKIPLIPFALAVPVKNDYNLKDSTLSFILKPFQYTEKIFNALFPEKNSISISCDRHIAKRLCKSRKKIFLFGKIDIPLQWHEYILWEKKAGKLAQYSLDNKNSSELATSSFSVKKVSSKNNNSSQIDNVITNKDKQKSPIEYYTCAINMDEKDPKAFIYMNKAASLGFAPAQNYLGFEYYQKEKYTEAIAWWEKAAKEGYDPAQYNLGNCYETGTGIKKDLQKAIQYWQQSAKQGNGNAQYKLGDCYYSGQGVVQNMQKAIAYFEESDSHGNIWAEKRLSNYYFNLGLAYENVSKETQDYKKALSCYQKAAFRENPDAQFRIGLFYHDGKGVKRDYLKAVEYYLKAAKCGYAEAQRYLGNSYFKGEGVKQDFYKAVYWYQFSANQGNAKAQYSLGFCYYYGKGTIKNFEKAVNCWQKASEQGHVLAQYNLGICYYKGDGTEQNYQKAKIYWQKAADQGNKNAQYNLGVCYYQGKGTDENRQEAIKWWQKAAEGNHELAKKVLQKLKII